MEKSAVLNSLFCTYIGNSIIWGEPERAPHLMMSTAVCMSFVRSFVLSSYVRTYGKHSPGYEW